LDCLLSLAAAAGESFRRSPGSQLPALLSAFLFAPSVHGLLLFYAVMAHKPVRVLTVDDEPSVTLSLRYVFADPRYEVVAVSSGYAALAELNSSPFDAIIVDEKMPNLSGRELVRAIKERCNPAKIIVVSARLLPEVRQAYESLNVDAMFDKPFDVRALRDAVDRIVA
jgi:CheY-like chemotaxis protein